MKNLLAALLLCVYGLTNAQTDYSFVYDPDAIIAEGNRLYDEKKYDEAIAQYDKISLTDPQYIKAQCEKAIALTAADKKDEAKNFYEQALKKGFMEEYPDFYIAYGNFLSDAKEYAGAEKMLLEAQKSFPNSSSLMYYLGLLYIRKEERQKGIDYLEKAITLSPNSAGAHYMLGLVALEDGHVTEGTLALLSYLMLVSDGGSSQNAIIQLNKKFGENYLKKGTLVFSRNGGDDFSEIDEILRNQLPLRKAYKVKSAIDDVITRQVQAVAEYAVNHKTGNGFFETMYIPWLADVVKRDQFEGFSYYILLGLQNELGDKLASQKKKIASFRENYVDKYFWQSFAKRKVDLFGTEQEVVVYLKNKKPYLLGAEINGQKEGKYKVLYESGNLYGEFNFKNNQFEGLQKYFDEKGRLTEEKTFTGGKANGKRTTYFENGNISVIENYKNDLLEGASSSFYVNGGKFCEGNFIADERDGELVCLYENGIKKSDINYSKGKIDGKCLMYNEAGDLTNDVTYKMGVREGKCVQFYDGKVVKAVSEYKDGKHSASDRDYYPNSTLEEETVYVNDTAQSATSFYPNGQKSLETAYDEEGYASAYSYFNYKGEKYFEESYKKGELKSGLQFERGQAKPIVVDLNKAYTIKDFDGAPILQAKYSKGKKTGQWEFNYITGIKKTEENYDNNLQSGIEYKYGTDARLVSIANYTRDTISGLYQGYSYGKLSEDYRYSNGDKNGPAHDYYSDGTLSAESFYNNDGLASKAYSYWQNGTVSEVTEYVEGICVMTESYTPEGKKENVLDYTNKTGRILQEFNNGSTVHEFNLVNGERQGKYTIKDKLGNLLLETNYANGKRHGNYKAYGPLGALNVDLNFYTGSINGINKYYDVVGNLIQITNYAFGDATGTDTRFYQNKEKFREFTQFDENKEGEAKYYNLQGQMVLILGYQDDILTYYMTMDKDGKCSGKTAVATETANIISKYPNGKTAIEINIEKGNIDGKFGVYSVDGNPQITAIYHHGVLNGPRFEYYSNGQVYKKENFEQESYEGLQEFYKEDGKLWLTAAYKNDELHGLCKVYTNGIVSQTLRYDSDILVEVSK